MYKIVVWDKVEWDLCSAAANIIRSPFLLFHLDFFQGALYNINAALKGGVKMKIAVQ